LLHHTRAGNHPQTDVAVGHALTDQFDNPVVHTAAITELIQVKQKVREMSGQDIMTQLGRTY
jgi:hypothetical protein